MPVDEFGREIPAARGGRRSPSPQRRLQQDVLGSGGLPSHLYDPLPTSRYDGERNERDRDRDRMADDRNSSRKRKHRSRSPPRRRDRNSDGGNDRDRSYHPDSNKPHPSVIYVEEPMLCQYLWKEANEGKTDEDYDEYRKSYCLNYVRTFFNEHMDDSWFRSLYSPLERYEVELQERRRAAQEAREFLRELESSLAKTSSSNEKDPSFFVLKARLGGGIRQTGKQDYHHSHHSPSKSSRPSSLVNPIPATHVLALTSQVLPILEVPHYVTDEQLTVALMQQVSPKTSKEVDPGSMVLFSGPPTANLTRTTYFQATDEVRKEIIQTLNHSDRGATAAKAAKSAKDGASHVPRKEDTFLPKTLELVVECSDAYGRLEVDADGKGGEPDERGGVPPRKASVWISTRSLAPNVQVLSAALSSTKRIRKDQTDAFNLAKAFDNKREIPLECRLESLLPKAIPNFGPDVEDPSTQSLEDALDVTIAYLRRVHLFSYYNGCQSAPRVAEVFNGYHAVSTIHLRLANADEMLAEPVKSSTGTSIEVENALPKTDLLVQRLNDSIEAALMNSEKWNSPAASDIGDDLPATCIVIDNEVDQQAKDIKYQETQVEEGWIEDHALIDEDGRARCAFHFCRKLFKDSSFLKKHLIKKHSEFLRAEIAKCHDSYMMTSWDSQVQRPVPPILVDCGHRFGLKPSPVLGAAEPIAEDPEPELWKREEERRLIEEKEAEARRERYNNSHNYHNNNNDGGGVDMALSDGRGQGRKSNFEDVDDMKVEKVEIAFDKIEIPIQPPKKKKKKKRLL